MQHYISLVIITRRSSGCMDWLFFAQQLPHGMHDKILALADGCLSRQYRGDGRVCRFWLFRNDGLTEHHGAVLDEVWRAQADLDDDEDGGELCQTCGVRRRDLHPVDVAFVQITVHRRVTVVPSTGASADLLGELMRWEKRSVCRECFHLLFVPSGADGPPNSLSRGITRCHGVCPPLRRCVIRCCGVFRCTAEYNYTWPRKITSSSASPSASPASLSSSCRLHCHR